MISDGARCRVLGRIRDGSGWLGMARDGSGWLGMARDGLGGSRMLEGGLGWLGMAREARDTWESAGTTETHFPWRGAVSFKVPNAHVRWLYTSH